MFKKTFSVAVFFQFTAASTISLRSVDGHRHSLKVTSVCVNIIDCFACRMILTEQS